MREILFRGLSVNGNKWVYGHLIYWAGNYQIWETEEDGETHNYLAKPESIGQFTGLLDKNGNKIFEGDILQEDWFQFEVIYDTESAKFRLKSINHYQYPSWNRGIKMEIIGNIHEKTKL